MAKVFAKWIVEGNRGDVEEAIENDGFYIQVYENEDDDNSDTIYSSEAETTLTPIKTGRNRGRWEVLLVGEASGPVLSPGYDDDIFPAFDQNGKEIGEAEDFGEVA